MNNSVSMTHQEIFDKVTDHLFTQGKPAVLNISKNNYVCAYRDKEGLRCAVGVLIPDEMYVVAMESATLSALLTRSQDMGFALPDVITNPDNKELLTLLQTVHDNSYTTDNDIIEYLPFTPEYLNNQLGAVAMRFNLTYKPRE